MRPGILLTVLFALGMGTGLVRRFSLLRGFVTKDAYGNPSMVARGRNFTMNHLALRRFHSPALPNGRGSWHPNN